MSSAAEVNHLRYWLNNLRQDPRLTAHQFVAMEKAINMAIAIFENVTAATTAATAAGDTAASQHHLSTPNTPLAKEAEQPMEIDIG